VRDEFALGHLLRRVAAGLLASIAATGALVVSPAMPASADYDSSWAYIWNGATGYCLATDWSSNVYTWAGCDGPQLWRWHYLDAYPGTAMLQNEATGRCLKQEDFVHVISASCDGSIAEFRWKASNDGYIWSTNTGGYLTTDYTGSVTLYNATPPSNQYWRRINPAIP